ncbi:MAG TPA: hypothetical protein VJQ26_12805 [Ktedonobacteraceae bacterium]|nr:hypothetical protein [Ktedonobacteraceae bacterium]
MMTTRLTMIGFVLLLLVMILTILFVAYWHQVTGTNIMPLLAPITQSC